MKLVLLLVHRVWRQLIAHIGVQIRKSDSCLSFIYDNNVLFCKLYRNDYFVCLVCVLSLACCKGG